MLSIRMVRPVLAVLAAAAILVAPSVAQDLAPATRSAPGGDASALETELRREIARALHEIGRKKDWTASDLAGTLETGPALLPLLARHFREGDSGIAAVRLAGALPGTRIRELVRAVADAMRIDPAFREAATIAFVDASKRGDVESLLEETARPDVPQAVGLALISAAARVAHPKAPAAIGGALTRSPEEQKLAVSFLLEAGLLGRDALRAGLASGRLSPDAALLVMGALLPEARANEARALGKAILENDGGLERARGSAIGPEARRGIAAELLAVPLTDERQRLLAHVLGIDPSSPRERVLNAAFGLTGVSDDLQAIARERGRKPRASAAELFPDGFHEKPHEPIDVPDLIDGLDLVGPEDRADVAAAAAALGHPEGIATLGRLACHLQAPVRARVAQAIGAARATLAANLLPKLLADADLDVVAVAATCLDELELPLEPSAGAPALARLLPPESDFVLAAMRRHGPPETVTSLLLDALERSAVADAYAAAACVMDLHEADGPDFPSKFLGHRDPMVRVAAIHALGNPDDADRSARVSVLERVSADPDPIVRAVAARRLGRIRDDFARARLVVLTRDPSWCVREAAIVGLGGQDKAHVVPIIRRAENDSQPLVANAARVALVRQGVESAAPSLVADLGDPAAAPRTRLALLKLIGAKNLDDAELAAEVTRLIGVDSRPR
jgi:HEAT repeat protein